MRKLMIRFNGEGEYFREIDEDRHYFLSEAEEIIDKIRRRLRHEKRVVTPKPFECWIDGQQLIITHASFESESTLEQQLKSTMLNFGQWEEEIRHKFSNKLEEYAEEERQLFLNKEFQAFSTRFDQLLGSSKVKPFPLLLDIQALKRLFDEVYVHVSTGFYSELEEILTSMKIAYKTVVNYIETEDMNGQLNVDTVNNWIKNDENFHRFVLYASSCYQSIPKGRVVPLATRFLPYQELELNLFKNIASEIGFENALKYHEEMIKNLHEKYDNILFQGFVLKTEEVVESLVISPVVSECLKKVMANTVNGDEVNDHEKSRGKENHLS